MGRSKCGQHPLWYSVLQDLYGWKASLSWSQKGSFSNPIGAPQCSVLQNLSEQLLAFGLRLLVPVPVSPALQEMGQGEVPHQMVPKGVITQLLLLLGWGNRWIGVRDGWGTGAFNRIGRDQGSCIQSRDSDGLA